MIGSDAINETISTLKNHLILALMEQWKRGSISSGGSPTVQLLD